MGASSTQKPTRDRDTSVIRSDPSLIDIRISDTHVVRLKLKDIVARLELAKNDGADECIVHLAGISVLPGDELSDHLAAIPMPYEEPAEIESEDKAMSTASPLKPVFEKWKDCTACPYSKTREQVVFGSGNVNDPKVMVIGEAPGPEENKQGVPFVGVTGTLMRQTCDSIGLDLEKDAFVSNSLLCFPTNDGMNWHNPNGPELLECRPHLEEMIDALFPTLEVILLVGKRAYASFFMADEMKAGGFKTEKDWNRIKMNKVIGWYRGVQPWGDKPKVYTIYHPSYIKRQDKSGVPGSKLFEDWKTDLQTVKDFALAGQFYESRK